MTKNNKTIGLVIGFIAVAGIFFYGGMKYAAAQRTNMMQAARGSFTAGAGGFTAGARGGRGTTGIGGGFTTGQVISKDATSITVKLPTGGSKIILLSGSTKVEKSVDGTSDDLTTGTNVMVSGTANSDGSISAQSVQIRPVMPTAPANTQ